MTSIPADRTHSRPRTRTPSAFRPHVVGAVFSRDFIGYFSNPAGYVFITLFVLVCSWAAFWQPAFFARNLADLEPLNEWMPYLLLVFVPAITMSVWAEERRQGTDELLLTLPARDVEVVLGKYLAALGIFVVALLFLAVGHVPLLMSLGRPDYGILASTYLGYALMGALLIAIGMVASAISTGATVAYILGAVFCAIPVFASGLGPVGQMLADLPWIGRLFGTTTATNTAGSGVARMLDTLSVPSQFRDFGAGVIPLDGLIYFLGLAAAMLYLNMVLIGRRHWRGGRASGGRWLHATTRVTAVVVALVALYLIAGRWAVARLDATAERLHTLTDVSRDVIAQIPSDRPVYIQAYYSAEVPREYVEVKTNLINTLEEFAAIGGGRVLLNLVETRPFTANAREAEQQFGITAREVSGASGGRRRATEPIYLGVAFTSGLEQVVIPFFDRGLPVEYELTRSIRVVSGTERKRVGILKTDAQLLVDDEMQRMMGQQSEWEIVAELKKQYEVTPISAEGPLPLAEIQTISTAGEPTGGTFTLSFEGETTPPLPLSAPIADVAKALEALKGIGTGRIVLEGGPLAESPISVTFAGPSAGKNVPELVAEATLEGGEKPTIRVGTTRQVLDVLIVAQPSSLTQPEIDNLRDYISGGGPTLLLTDPFPAVSPAIAPSEPKPPGPASFRGMPTPEKGDLVPLLNLLGVSWPSNQIVWDSYNPHPELQFPEEYVFVGKGSDAAKPFGDDPTSTELEEVLVLFSGLYRKAGGEGASLEYVPLLQTGSLGGTLTYDDLIDPSSFGGPRFRTSLPHFPSGESATLAVRVRGTLPEAPAPEPPGDPDAPPPPKPQTRSVHAILIADLDFISDPLFDLRRRAFEAYDRFNFDNVTFILNCVDSLAGDESFLELRKKRPKHRTLEAIEDESERYIQRSQSERQDAEAKAAEELAAAQARLTKAVDAIREDPELDERTKESQVRNRRDVEERRLAAAKSEIEDQKEAALRESRIRQEEAISSIENRVRAQAIVLTPLPALVLGGVVFFLRARRENRGANPERLA